MSDIYGTVHWEIRRGYARKRVWQIGVRLRGVLEESEKNEDIAKIVEPFKGIEIPEAVEEKIYFDENEGIEFVESFDIEEEIECRYGYWNDGELPDPDDEVMYCKIVSSTRYIPSDYPNPGFGPGSVWDPLPGQECSDDKKGVK